MAPSCLAPATMFDNGLAGFSAVEADVDVILVKAVLYAMPFVLSMELNRHGNCSIPGVMTITRKTRKKKKTSLKKRKKLMRTRKPIKKVAKQELSAELTTRFAERL